MSPVRRYRTGQGTPWRHRPCRVLQSMILVLRTGLPSDRRRPNRFDRNPVYEAQYWTWTRDTLRLLSRPRIYSTPCIHDPVYTRWTLDVSLLVPPPTARSDSSF